MSDKIIRAGAYLLLGAVTAAAGVIVGIAIVKITRHIVGILNESNIREKLMQALQSSQKKRMKKALGGYIRAVVTKKKNNVISFDVLEQAGKFAEVTLTADEISDTITKGMTIDYAVGV